MTQQVRFGTLDPIERHELHVSSTEYVTVGLKSELKILLEYAYYLPLSGRTMAGELTILNNGVAATAHNEYSVIVSDFDDVELTAEISGLNVVLKIVTPALIENPVLKFRRKAIAA
jgi:hypothetical protein